MAAIHNFLFLKSILLLFHFTTKINALTPLSTVKIGAQFPLYKTCKAGTCAEDAGGRRRQAAFLLAVKHINDKTDGFYDTILPNTNLEIAYYDSKRDEGVAVVNAFRLWNDFNANIAVGPASSGPSKQAQQVLKVDDIQIPQVGYSATSDQLSDVTAYPLFLRLPPSDAYQANVMAATISQQNWQFVCVLHGTDAYSAAGAAALIASLPASKLTLRRSASFEAGTTSVKSQISQLKKKGCQVVVMWAQSSDIVTISLEADRQGFTSEKGILWFSSEIMLGAFEDVCSDRIELCQRVFKGALLLSPNYGTGTAMYQKIAAAWHSQTSKVGSPSRTDLTGCDDTVDARGGNNLIWQVDHDGDSTTTKKCVAVDFNDYDRDEAAAFVPETIGDGRISNYVPYSYDVGLAIANGIHNLFETTEWKNGATESEKSTLFTGKKLYTSMLNVKFDGFSGNVQFRTINSDGKHEGDREAAAMEFFLWNYGSSKFSVIGSTYSNGTFIQSKNIVWPGDGTKPDDRPKCIGVDYNRTMNTCDVKTGNLVVTSVYDSTQCQSTENNTAISASRCLYSPIEKSPFVITLSCLAAVMQITALIYAVKHRKTKTMKTSQFELLALFNVGLLLTSLSPILFLGAPSAFSCVARIWIFNLGLSLSNAALVVKIWRVEKVFHNKKMKHMHLKLKRMLTYVMMIVLVEIFLLVIMTLVPSMRVRPIFVEASVIFPLYSSIHGKAVHGLCAANGSAAGTLWSTFQSSYHIIMVAYVAWLSYSLRNEPQEFQESKWLGLIGMNVFSVGTVVGAVYFGMSSDLPYSSLLLLQTVGTFLICTIAVVLMYGPKVAAINAGDHGYKKKGSESKSSGSGNGSKGSTGSNGDSATASNEYVGSNITTVEDGTIDGANNDSA